MGEKIQKPILRGIFKLISSRKVTRLLQRSNSPRPT